MVGKSRLMRPSLRHRVAVAVAVAAAATVVAAAAVAVAVAIAGKSLAELIKTPLKRGFFRPANAPVDRDASAGVEICRCAGIIKTHKVSCSIIFYDITIGYCAFLNLL
jgi:hypothetical protein